MGFAPTWLRQVSPLLHMTTLTTGYILYTEPDPQFLAPARSLEIGPECPVFRRIDLATLFIAKTTC